MAEREIQWIAKHSDARLTAIKLPASIVTGDRGRGDNDVKIRAMGLQLSNEFASCISNT